MARQYRPEIRVISVEHERTVKGEQILTHAMQNAGLDIPVLGVYCHLEAGRCGVKSGRVALEVDGAVIWEGEEITQKLAETVCRNLPEYIKTNLQ